MKILLIYSPTYGEKELLYDDEDQNFVGKYTWYLAKFKHSHSFYARTHIYTPENKRTVKLFHRLLLNINNSHILIDHKDHNGLNNQKENLRICNTHQNMGNRRIQSGSSRFKGVSRLSDRKSAKIWKAQIRIDSEKTYLGVYTVEEEAARAYDAAARIYFGKFASLNFPLEQD